MIKSNLEHIDKLLLLDTLQMEEPPSLARIRYSGAPGPLDLMAFVFGNDRFVLRKFAQRAKSFFLCAFASLREYFFSTNSQVLT